MYYYSFGVFAGHDMVWIQDNDKVSIPEIGTIWKTDTIYHLSIGETVAFEELYMHKKNIEKNTIISKKLFSQSCMGLIHDLVHTFYSSYRKVIPLFITEQQIQYNEKNPRKKTIKQKARISNNRLDYASQKLFPTTKKNIGIQVRIFPDIRTLSTMITTLPDDRITKNCIIMGGSQTDKQKYLSKKKYYSQKNSVVFLTIANIFFDRELVSEVNIIRPQARNFSYQRDPRIKIKDFIDLLEKNYTIKVNYRK